MISLQLRRSSLISQTCFSCHHCARHKSSIARGTWDWLSTVLGLKTAPGIESAMVGDEKAEMQLAKSYQDSELVYDSQQVAKVDEKQLAAICNVSRLKPELRNKMRHVRQPPNLSNNAKLSESLPWSVRREELRSIYAEWGCKSGVDPAILFPTRKELREMAEHEVKWEIPLGVMLARIEAEAHGIEQFHKEREEEVHEGMKQMDKLVGEYKTRVGQKRDTAHKMSARKRQLLEEAQDKFGYDITLHSPEFEQFLEQKEEEEKKQKKLEQKARKLQRQRERARLKMAASSADHVITGVGDKGGES